MCQFEDTFRTTNRSNKPSYNSVSFLSTWSFTDVCQLKRTVLYFLSSLCFNRWGMSGAMYDKSLPEDPCKEAAKKLQTLRHRWTSSRSCFTLANLGVELQGGFVRNLSVGSQGGYGEFVGGVWCGGLCLGARFCPIKPNSQQPVHEVLCSSQTYRKDWVTSAIGG